MIAATMMISMKPKPRWLIEAIVSPEGVHSGEMRRDARAPREDGRARLTRAREGA